MPPESGEIYDIVVVGAGPAGSVAALYSYRNNFKTLLIGENFGGATLVSGEIENWPGMINTNGFELSEKLEEQIKHYCKGEDCYKRGLVDSVSRENDLYKINCGDGGEYFTRSVIYAAGSESRKLNIPGEQEYRNKGVTYCATCDGPLFRGKEVAVIGGGNSALKAALMMKNIAAKVTAITINPKFLGEQISIDQLQKASEAGIARIVVNGKTIEVKGNGKFVESIVVLNTETQEKEEIKVQGVFVEIGLLPITKPIKALGVAFNSVGEIITDRDAKTNLPGFFAAGDVTDVRDKQIVVAAGMGSIAALSAADYLSGLGR